MIVKLVRDASSAGLGARAAIVLFAHAILPALQLDAGGAAILPRPIRRHFGSRCGYRRAAPARRTLKIEVTNKKQEQVLAEFGDPGHLLSLLPESPAMMRSMHAGSMPPTCGSLRCAGR